MSRTLQITEFHGSLLKLQGSQIHAVNGWSSESSQLSRFQALLKGCDYAGGSVIDYGCGTGELLPFLCRKKEPTPYKGYDALEEMIDVARRRHGNYFENIAFDQVPNESADYVLASGVFQFLDRDAEQYYEEIIRDLFDIANIALGVNFLSSSRNIENKAAGEMYLNAATVVKVAQSLTAFWKLDHAYHDGGGDLTIVLFKREKGQWKRPPFPEARRRKFDASG